MDVNVYAIRKLIIFKWIHLPFKDHIEHIHPRLHFLSMKLPIGEHHREETKKILSSFVCLWSLNNLKRKPGV
mgnify:FL=1